MSDLTKQSELKELALKIDVLRKRRDDMLRSNNWIQDNQDEYILELDTQWPTISNALRSPASAGVREALEQVQVRTTSGDSYPVNGERVIKMAVLALRSEGHKTLALELQSVSDALSDHGVQESAGVEGVGGASTADMEAIAAAYEAGAIAVHNHWCNSGESVPPWCADFSEAARDYARSLLSGANTKSDGGVVADTPSNETATEVMAHPSPMGSRSCDEKTIACGVAGVAPGPSDQLTKTPSADHDDGNLRAALEQLLQCPALADENHSDPSWGCADTAQAISAARAALSAPNHQPHAVSQGWQPIETAPRDGTPFIGAFWSIRWADSHRRGDIVRCWYQPEFDAFISSCREMTMAPGYTINGKTRELHSPRIEPVTHWMPLPAPPSPAKTGGAS